MRPIWSGSLSFSLVNIPVKLYSATTSATIDFDLFRGSDLSPIKYVRIAESDGREVPYDELVRGFQYHKDEYVILTDDDFQKASIKKARTIEVTRFVAEDQIDSILFVKPYYLKPDKGAEKPYALLSKALEDTGQVGVAVFVMRNREHLCIVKPHRGTLILIQLRFVAEIRDVSELEIEVDQDLGDDELELATAIIDKLTRDFNPADYSDTYNRELLDLIEAKAAGQEIHMIEEEIKPTKITDLMSVLKKSLEQAGTAS